MKRIKRNAIIEAGIKFGGFLPQIDGIATKEFVRAIVESCKSKEKNKIFTSEEIDAIMQVLESMPGYTPEKFLVFGAPLSELDETAPKCFGWQMYVAYIMLSITNPELFEDYEEGKNEKDSEKNED